MNSDSHKIRKQADVISTDGDVWMAWEIDVGAETFYIQETGREYHILKEAKELEHGGWTNAESDEKKNVIAILEAYLVSKTQQQT